MYSLIFPVVSILKDLIPKKQQGHGSGLQQVFISARPHVSSNVQAQDFVCTNKCILIGKSQFIS